MKNIEIIQRLFEIAKNPLDYSLQPKPFKEEHIFLANVLNDSISVHEREFNDLFKKAVGQYKTSILENGEFGSFRNPEKLVWIKTHINQLTYAVYGEDYIHEIKFRNELGKIAYKDLIEQIDRTALMTSEELKKHNENCNKIASEILQKVLKENK